MIKIPTIFERDESKKGHPVTNEWKPECYWVREGEGIPTQKIDGMNVKVENGQLFKRQKPKERDYDMASYVPCNRNDPGDKWLWTAFDYQAPSVLEDGIYETWGKHIQGNPYGVEVDCMTRVLPVSESLIVIGMTHTFEGFRQFFEENPGFEGLVFHHPDGRMAKIKRRDYGLPWPVKPIGKAPVL